MARITFLGGPETGDVDRLTWGNPHWRKHGLAHPPIVFPLNVPVEVVDQHIISKAAGNRFFRVELDDPAEQVPADDPAPGAGSPSTERAISVDSGGDCRSDVEPDLFVATIRDLVTAKGTSWTGTAVALLAAIPPGADRPKNARALSVRLTKAEAALHQLGIVVARGRVGNERTRQIILAPNPVADANAPRGRK